MRFMLTNSSEYMLSPDIIVCSSLEDLYVEINRNRKKDENDNVLFIFVDTIFTSSDILSQLEMFKYEFEDFRIILDKTQSLVIDLSSKSKKECYYLTTVSSTATEIFLNMSKYEEKFKVLDKIEELKRNLDNRNIIKNLVEYDFISFKSTLQPLISGIEILIKNSIKLKENVESLILEKKDLLRDLDKATRTLEKCETNRKELLVENLKLKYQNYLDNIPISGATTVTPLIYVKCLLTKNENDIINFFNILNGFLRSKYNCNSTLIVIEDYRTITLKKMKENFTYISSSGEYNMASIGNKIITTAQYVKSLFENFEKFSGIKDLFIVVDLTSSTSSYVIGNGAYVVITNEMVREEIYNKLDIETIDESSIIESFSGEDEFNIELNLTKSKQFKEFEKTVLELI